MKKTLFLTSLLFSFSALAGNNITSFRCVTNKVIEGNVPTVVEFQVQDLGTSKLNFFTEDPDSYEPVKMTPEFSVLMLNENGGIEQEDNRIVLSSDGDGCQLTEFVLYKNSGYKNGWARVRDTGCGASPAYSTLICEVK